MRANPNLPPAVIVGMEANGLGVVRALAMYQIPCIGVAGPIWNPYCQTRMCRVIRTRSWNETEVISELKAIAKTLTRKAPLIITKDEPVLWISECRDELSDAYEICLPAKHTVDLLMSKTGFLGLAAREKWPVPRFWEINNRESLITYLRDVTYPCILKPRMKTTSFRTYSPRKAFKINSQSELLSVYDMVAKWEKEVVVQEWIDGGDDRIVFCLTYYDRNGCPRVLFPGRKLLQWPIQCGNTAISEPAPKRWENAINELTKRIWESIEFKGIGSIEFKIRQDSNDLLIIEPTVGRTNYQNELAVINGQNIPAIAYCDLTGRDFKPLPRESTRTKLIDGRGEIKASFEMVRCREFSIRRWLRNRKGKKKYMILRMNDIGPFVMALYVGVRKLLDCCLSLGASQKARKTLANAIRSHGSRKV